MERGTEVVSKREKKRHSIVGWIVWLALGGVVFGLLCWAHMRAKQLPSVEVPILVYERVGELTDDAGSIPQDLFYQQMRDLSAKGYHTVSLWRLWAYAKWGVALPSKPLVLTFDHAYRNLLTDVAPILEEQQFSAVVNLATTYIAPQPSERRSFNGAAMMTWDEIRVAMEGDILSFGGHTRNHVDLRIHEKPFNEIRASRTDIKRATGYRTHVFSYPFGSYSPTIARAAAEAHVWYGLLSTGGVAQIDAQTDFLALPRIPVKGGHHLFTVEGRERYQGDAFGYVRVVHDKGPVFVANISILDAEHYQPISELKAVDLRTGVDFEVPIPKSAVFPIELEVRDETGILLYHSVLIQRRDVKRDTPAGQPPVRVELDVSLEGLEMF